MPIPPSHFNPLAREFVPGKKTTDNMQNPDDNSNPNVPGVHNHNPNPTVPVFEAVIHNPNVPGVVTAVGCSFSAVGGQRRAKSERERNKNLKGRSFLKVDKNLCGQKLYHLNCRNISHNRATTRAGMTLFVVAET